METNCDIERQFLFFIVDLNIHVPCIIDFMDDIKWENVLLRHTDSLL